MALGRKELPDNGDCPICDNPFNTHKEADVNRCMKIGYIIKTACEVNIYKEKHPGILRQ